MRHGTMIGRHRSSANLPKGGGEGGPWLIGKSFAIPMETPMYGYTVRAPLDELTPREHDWDPPPPLPSTYPPTNLFRVDQLTGDRYYLYYPSGPTIPNRTVTGEGYASQASSSWFTPPKYTVATTLATRVTPTLDVAAIDTTTGRLVRFRAGGIASASDFNGFYPGYNAFGGSDVSSQYPWAPYYNLAVIHTSRGHDQQHTYAWATINNISDVQGGEVDVDWTITLRRGGTTSSGYYYQHFPLQWMENGGERFFTMPLTETQSVELTVPRFEHGRRYEGQRYQADYRLFDAHRPPPWDTNGPVVPLGRHDFTAEVATSSTVWTTIDDGPSYVRLSDSSGAHDLVRTPTTNMVEFRMHNKAAVV